MKHGRGNLAGKRPRYNPVVAWEANNLTNDFVDISRLALDDRYGKVGAPLSKRRNGIGPTRGNTPGLFGHSNVSGLIDYKSKQEAMFVGAITAVAIYGAVDFYLTKGYKLTGWQRRLLRSPLTAALTVAALFVIIPND